MLVETKDKRIGKVFSYFEEISKIPRISGIREPIANYLVEFAKARGLEYIIDRDCNVVIKKPCSKGLESRPTVILQGHTDIVADKTPCCPLDLTKDGLRLYCDGDFLKAEGTTLGADNGVAVAYMLAILDSDDIPHPNIEAVFTSDEEIGLLGAEAIDAKCLTGRYLINIDSDEEGVFTVGCAGGMISEATLEISKAEEVKDVYRLVVNGLVGGHSGTEITKCRMNAIKILAEILSDISGIEISEISGGNADNAIPRYAEATLYLPSVSRAQSVVSTVKDKYIGAEPAINISIEPLPQKKNVISPVDSIKIIDFITKMPTGVYKMSVDFPDLPETSLNLGILDYDGERVKLSFCVRSSKDDEKRTLANKISEICREFGASYREHGLYPAWEYKKDSNLRDTMVKIYKERYGESPKVITIHAGLECGIFTKKIPNVECISIGPNAYDGHTTDERLSIKSTARTFEYLLAVLENI